MLDLIVTLPHLIAVFVVIGWLIYGRRLNESEPSGGREDGSGGKRTRPPIPQLPITSLRGRRDDLARSA
jgi:hypothetical protein